MLLALFLLLPAHPGDVLLPDGPAARAWAAVDPQAPVTDAWITSLGEDAPKVLALTDPWSDPSAWRSWGRWLGPGQRTSAESAALAILAARQGRPADAWSHYAALVSDPAAAAAAMPRLLPGIPPGLPPEAPLPNDCTLHPVPPPGSLAAARGRTRPVTASTEFRLGEATLRLVISVEPSGVEITLHHLSGGPATFRVQLPELLEREIRVSYIDWMRQDARNEPLNVELTPGMEGSVQLFGRFLARKDRLPALPESALPTQLLQGGLWLEAQGEEPEDALHEAVAHAISTCLCVRAGTRRVGSADPRSPSAGTIVRIAEGPKGVRTLARIASATEAWVRSR